MVPEIAEVGGELSPAPRGKSGTEAREAGAGLEAVMDTGTPAAAPLEPAAERKEVLVSTEKLYYAAGAGL